MQASPNVSPALFPQFHLLPDSIQFLVRDNTLQSWIELEAHVKDSRSLHQAERDKDLTCGET